MKRDVELNLTTWTRKTTVGLWFKGSYKSECLKHHFTAFDTPSLARFIVNSRQFWKHLPSVVSLYQRSLKCSLVDVWVFRPAPPVATSQYTIRSKIVYIDIYIYIYIYGLFWGIIITWYVQIFKSRTQCKLRYSLLLTLIVIIYIEFD